eukprot:gene2988-17917_t
MPEPLADWNVIAIRDFTTDTEQPVEIKKGTFGTVDENVGNDILVAFKGTDALQLILSKNIKRYLRYSMDNVGMVERWDVHRSTLYGFASSNKGRVFIGKRDVLRDHLPSMGDQAIVSFPDTKAEQQGLKALRVEVIRKSTVIAEEVKVEPGAGANTFNGIVKDVHGTYGFISDANNKDTFFHISQWRGDDDPLPGAMVTYSIRKGKGGRMNAVDVVPGTGRGRLAGGGRGKVIPKPRAKNRADAQGDEQEDEKVQRVTKSAPEMKPGQGEGNVTTGAGAGTCNAEAARAGFLYVFEGIGQSVL